MSSIMQEKDLGKKKEIHLEKKQKEIFEHTAQPCAGARDASRHEPDRVGGQQHDHDHARF